MLGQEGRGLKHAFETLGRIRLAHIGARAVGRATRILDLMTDYARAFAIQGRTLDSERNSRVNRQNMKVAKYPDARNATGFIS